MARSVGTSKTGGRKKGTPNKRTLAFGELLQSRGMDLLAEILDAAKALPKTDRIGIYMGLLPYQYPKRKPTEQEQPTSLEDYIETLSRPQLSELHRAVGQRMGLNKPLPELSIDELEAYKETIEGLISHREVYEMIGDGDDC